MELYENLMYYVPTKNEIHIPKQMPTSVEYKPKALMPTIVEIPEPDYEDSESNSYSSLSDCRNLSWPSGHAIVSPIPFNSRYEKSWNSIPPFFEVPEPDYDDLESNMYCTIDSQSHCSNISSRITDSPAPVTPNYKRSANRGVECRSIETRPRVRTVPPMSILHTLCVVCWQICATFLIIFGTARYQEKGIHYLWTTIEGYVVLALAAFLMFCYFAYILRFCLMEIRNHRVAVSPIQL